MRIIILFFVMSFIFYLIPETKNKNIVFEREYKIKRTIMEEINYYSTIYSKKYKIEKNLLLAVMKLESNFNPRCKNPKSSAFGLGQFLIKTSNWVAVEKLKYKNYSHYDSNIEVQVHMTAWYLRYLINKHKNEKVALTAYNGFEYPNFLYAKRVYKIKNDFDKNKNDKTVDNII